MKPETKEWLDKLVPLLVHLKEGKKILNKQDTTKLSIHGTNLDQLLANPDLYQIHIEPRVIYVNEYEHGLNSANHKTVGQAISSRHYGGAITTRRFIEDLNWKPDLDADHHLPEPASKQDADYMKTV